MSRTEQAAAWSVDGSRRRNSAAKAPDSSSIGAADAEATDVPAARRSPIGASSAISRCRAGLTNGDEGGHGYFLRFIITL